MTALGRMAPLQLSLAAPAFNEAEGIEAVVDEWAEYLHGHPLVGEWEIVIVDDGSDDGTGDVLERLQLRHPELVVQRFAVNRGAGEAIAAAIAATRCEWVLTLDSDGQFPIDNLDPMLRRIATRGGNAFVGARSRKADSRMRRWGSAVSGRMANLALGTEYRDASSVFRLARGSLIRSIHLESTGMNCSLELAARLAELDIPWVEIPAQHRERTTGSSALAFWSTARQRALFLGYLGVRRGLIRSGVLRAPRQSPRSVVIR